MGAALAVCWAVWALHGTALGQELDCKRLKPAEALAEAAERLDARRVEAVEACLDVSQKALPGKTARLRGLWALQLGRPLVALQNLERAQTELTGADAEGLPEEYRRAALAAIGAEEQPWAERFAVLEGLRRHGEPEQAVSVLHDRLVLEAALKLADERLDWSDRMASLRQAERAATTDAHRETIESVRRVVSGRLATWAEDTTQRLAERRAHLDHARALAQPEDAGRLEAIDDLLTAMQAASSGATRTCDGVSDDHALAVGLAMYADNRWESALPCFSRAAETGSRDGKTMEGLWHIRKGETATGLERLEDGLEGASDAESEKLSGLIVAIGLTVAADPARPWDERTSALAAASDAANTDTHRDRVERAALDLVVLGLSNSANDDLGWSTRVDWLKRSQLIAAAHPDVAPRVDAARRSLMEALIRDMERSDGTQRTELITLARGLAGSGAERAQLRSQSAEDQQAFRVIVSAARARQCEDAEARARSTASSTDDPMVLFELGRCHHSRGSGAQARQRMEAALAIGLDGSARNVAIHILKRYSGESSGGGMANRAAASPRASSSDVVTRRSAARDDVASFRLLSIGVFASSLPEAGFGIAVPIQLTLRFAGQRLGLLGELDMTFTVPEVPSEYQEFEVETEPAGDAVFGYFIGGSYGFDIGKYFFIDFMGGYQYLASRCRYAAEGLPQPIAEEDLVEGGATHTLGFACANRYAAVEQPAFGAQLGFEQSRMSMGLSARVLGKTEEFVGVLYLGLEL